VVYWRIVNDYRMIVVGGGMTGLSAALAWTKVRGSEREKVLVLERNATVGGCVASFSRGGFKFDTVQVVPDVSDLLAFFGVDLPMNRFDGCCARLFLADPQTKTAKAFEVPSSRDAFRGALAARFPAERRGIEAFFRACAAMHEELKYLKTEPTAAQIPGILLHCPRILAASQKTYHRFLRSFGIRGGELFEILDLFSSFSGLSGDRCAALLTTSAMTATLAGAWRPRGEFLRLPLALRDRLVEEGGEVRTNAPVARILVEDGAAAGVVLENGEALRADIVVCTADTQVFGRELVGSSVLERAGRAYAKKLAGARMSPSAFAIHLGLDYGLDLKALGYGCAYNVLTTGGGAYGSMFDAWDRGELLRRDDRFHLALYSRSAAAGGRNCLTIHVAPAPIAGWPALRRTDPERYRAEKERAADFYVRKVEEYLIPGLRGHIVLRDVATPATYARYIGSPAGSTFDMLPVPGNFGKNRLGTRTPVRNLFLPKFSNGIWPSMQAGIQVADMVSGGALMGGSARYAAGSAARR
jgi:phytoene dehydrogenase-like protein